MLCSKRYDWKKNLKFFFHTKWTQITFEIFESKIKLQQKRLELLQLQKWAKPDQLLKRLSSPWKGIHTDWWIIVVAVIFIRKVKILRYLFHFENNSTFPVQWNSDWSPFLCILILAKTRIWVSRLAVGNPHWSKKDAWRYGSKYKRILASCPKNGFKPKQSIRKNEETTFVLREKKTSHAIGHYIFMASHQKHKN